MSTASILALRFPALWLFFLGVTFIFGILRSRLRVRRVEKDWATLVQFNNVLRHVESSWGRNDAAGKSLFELAVEIEVSLDPPADTPNLAVLVPALETAQASGQALGRQASELDHAIRTRLIEADRILAERRREARKVAQSIPRMFLSGIAGWLTLPLLPFERIGILRHGRVLELEGSLLFQALLGVGCFLMLVGTWLAGSRLLSVLRQVSSY
ncbi:MAG: hypothetical protein ACREOU_08560 [Candidatus Eiseniibacteriota bacterium]